MLTETVDLAVDKDDWNSFDTPIFSARSGSFGSNSYGSWGVTSIGRGFDWDENDQVKRQQEPDQKLDCAEQLSRKSIMRPVTNSPLASSPQQSQLFVDTLRMSPANSRPVSPHSNRLVISPSPSLHSLSSSPRSPTVPRPRRRSSQKRVSLVAGRVSIAPMEPPSTPPALYRSSSTSSFLSVASSTQPPSPVSESFLGGKSISDYVIDGEIGRGAYGLVKRAREIQPDGLGPVLVIKQVIKSRILADCWKKHPKHGTIPIEIYVMSAISAVSYTLPPRRAWDPTRSSTIHSLEHAEPGLSLPDSVDNDWITGNIIKGHPNICPLLDFFEDSHYYYLVLPSTTPVQVPGEPAPPSDLFDLVEAYPQGLPPASIRSYLGQIADALSFLHSRGIVHRDIKDENVVLGPDGKCILIDFGSSGLVKKTGWDTFSGTLDYAGPEILRGERYHGKEQDVWAFGIVAYVLLCGECPFLTAEEAQEGMVSPFANASIALDDRCGDGKELQGEEADGGGALGDAAALVRACLQLDLHKRPTFERILQCRFLNGQGGWGLEEPF